MALGKNIKVKSVENDKEIISKKIKNKSVKKKLISKKEAVKKKTKTGDSVLLKYITEEKLRRKEELRKQYILNIDALKDKLVHFVTFRIGEEEYAIDIDSIKEVVPFSGVSKIPKTPDHVIGATVVRNNTIIAIDLEFKFQLQAKSEYNFTIALRNRNNKMGLLVNEIPSALKVNGNFINASLSDLESAIDDTTYIKGIVELKNRLIFYLDINELLEGDKIMVIPDKILKER